MNESKPLSRNMKYYYKNRERLIEQAKEDIRRRRRERHEMVLNVIEQRGGCIDCGNKDFRVLDFDHVRGKKSFNISQYQISKERWIKELDKCDIRCSNCHRIRHWNDKEGSQAIS